MGNDRHLNPKDRCLGSLAKQVLVALRLRDEAACDSFISVIDAYQAGATQALTATKASRFVKMANEVALREWFPLLLW